MQLQTLNQSMMYVIVAGILLYIIAVCFIFMTKSYRAGVAMGMDTRLMKRAITSSITFTILPSVSVLLGIFALGGSLGVPFSWLRLSVIGSLQYELNVAEIASSALGMNGLNLAQMTPDNFATIGLVITAGISFGAVFAIFGLKKYFSKVRNRPQSTNHKKRANTTILFIAMFIGLCSAYIGAYVGLFVSASYHLPLFTAIIAGASMCLFDYITVKKNVLWLDNFSLAASMIVAMAGASIMSIFFS